MVPSIPKNAPGCQSPWGALEEKGVEGKMRCERCQGQGIIKESWFMGQLCPECNGSGITYCCDEGGANPPNTYEQLMARPAPTGIDQRKPTGWRTVGKDK
jgi:DnaJ-class molecular chaperone